MEDQTIIRPTPGGRRPQRDGQQNQGHAGPQQAPQYTPEQPYNGQAVPPGGYQPAQQPHSQNPSSSSYGQPAHEYAPHQGHVGQPAQPAAPAYQPSPAAYDQQHHQSAVPMYEENPLIAMVSPLLTFASKIQSASECPNLDEFHRYALDQLNFYRSQGWGIQADPNTAHQISYAMCSLVDEIVLNTPWGSTSRWSGDSMLINLHQEAWGGENFFHYLQELMQRPATSLLVLEFYYCCLSLGFEGKYRRLSNGRRELDQLRSELYILITRHRNRAALPLSPAWMGLDVAHQGFVRHLPQWVIWSVALVLLSSSFIGFNWYLNQKSDQVMANLAAVGQADPLQVTPVNIDKLNRYVPAPPPVLDFQRLDLVGILTPALKSEIDNGVIELIDDATHTRVRIRHTKLFASGQAELSPRFIPLIERIGETIPELSAPIEVQGHSDNIPIFSARFPSNWVLSKARADSVGDLLKSKLPAQQVIRVEGLADSEPLVPNSSAKNRALNRRVEIVLRK
ncbi:type VI secretion system protein TssL, long form [Neptuniibacter sp. QD72_48]|uniref:type VI secretion system protein TssL, long form n=1 Tax=unclassified Neptuniibacter TaxID=2630693 RepID=UPI0039F472BD